MSRELDARVAREVMGLEIRNGLVRGAYAIGHYSTDMNSAMEVEQKMCDLGWKKSTFIHHTGGTWTAMFMNGPDLAEADADTPALAICLAALEARKSTG